MAERRERHGATPAQAATLLLKVTSTSSHACHKGAWYGFHEAPGGGHWRPISPLWWAPGLVELLGMLVTASRDEARTHFEAALACDPPDRASARRVQHATERAIVLGDFLQNLARYAPGIERELRKRLGVSRPIV
jgi:hypothetical protein